MLKSTGNCWWWLQKPVATHYLQSLNRQSVEIPILLEHKNARHILQICAAEIENFGHMVSVNKFNKIMNIKNVNFIAAFINVNVHLNECTKHTFSDPP